MKNNLKKIALGALAFASLGLTATSALADRDRHERANFGHGDRGVQQSQQFSQQINARQSQQMDRIQAGMRSGNLTRAEFRELMHKQRDIRAMEQNFRADGFIDAREFHRLNRALDVASSSIREERHDPQTRYAYGGYPRSN
jgi:uncharacterized membrane protein YebE (DUF533 family)